MPHPNAPLDSIAQARAARHEANRQLAEQTLAEQEARQARRAAQAEATEAKLTGLGYVPPTSPDIVSTVVAGTPQVSPVVRYVPPARLSENVTRTEAEAAGVQPWTSREERMRAVADPLYRNTLHGADYRRLVYARDAVTPDGVA